MFFALLLLKNPYDILIFNFFLFHSSIHLFLYFLGDFMARNGNMDNTKNSSSNIEFLKDNYKALLDKLICPNCLNFQSFEENFEKIRECRQCKEKFVKSKTSNTNNFERKNKENEEKRLLKIKTIEDSLYGSIGDKI